MESCEQLILSEVVALKAIDLFVVYKSLFASVNLLFSTIS